MQKSLSLFLKALRHENGKEKLSDMAHKLEVSASYLSTVENGKRVMHDKLFQNLVNLYQLSKTQAKELNILRNLEAKSISINTEKLDDERKDTVIQFLSSIDDLSSEEMRTIQHLINKKDTQ